MAAAQSEGGWTAARSAAGSRNPWLIVIVISLATFMEVLDTAIANVSLRDIGGELSVSTDEATWIVTSYLVANAVIVPISGWLANVVGRKRYYMFSVALFTGASLMCGLSSSLNMLLVARVLQGVGGGGLASSEQSILADTFPPSKRGLAFAAYGFVIVVAPVLGPTVGGWLTDNASWHWIFLINVPIGILSLFLVGTLMDEPKALIADRVQRLAKGLRVDYIGFALVALGLGCLEVTLDRGERLDWFADPLVVAMASVAAVALVGLVIWELNHEDPIVDLRLLRNRNFAVAVFVMMVIGVIIYGTTQLMPQFSQEVMGYTATDAGRALTAGGVISLFVMPFAGIGSQKLPARYLLFGALSLEAFALWHLSQQNSELSFGTLSTNRLWIAIGIPFLFVPVNTVAFVGLKPSQTNQASALLNVMRNLGGSFGISFAQTKLADMNQVHHARLAGRLQPLNDTYGGALANVEGALRSVGADPGGAVGQLAGQLARQSLTLSYMDVYRDLMIFVLVVTPLTLLLRQPKPGAAAAH